MAKSLKKKLKDGDVSLGGWVMVGHPASAEIQARSGFDFVCVDLEHSAIDINMAENLIRTIDASGSTPLVRLTNDDENLIKRVMDSGSSGVIVPLIKTAEDMRAAIDALYYPPRGTRGVGLARAQKYGADFEGYKSWLEENAVCIAQIEHIDAVKNFKDIMAVDGVDGYMLGPYDLSASMGLAGQIDHKDVQDAMNKVRDIAKDMGKPGGLHIVEPDEQKLKDSFEQGFTFIAYSIDTRIIDTVCRSAVSVIKGL